MMCWEFWTCEVQEVGIVQIAREQGLPVVHAA
jgi:hypothetical protein